MPSYIVTGKLNSFFICTGAYKYHHNFLVNVNIVVLFFQYSGMFEMFFLDTY